MMKGTEYDSVLSTEYTNEVLSSSDQLLTTLEQGQGERFIDMRDATDWERNTRREWIRDRDIRERSEIRDVDRDRERTWELARDVRGRDDAKRYELNLQMLKRICIKVGNHAFYGSVYFTAWISSVVRPPPGTEWSTPRIVSLVSACFGVILGIPCFLVNGEGWSPHSTGGAMAAWLSRAGCALLFAGGFGGIAATNAGSGTSMTWPIRLMQGGVAMFFLLAFLLPWL